MLVVDVTNKYSLGDAQSWIDEARRFGLDMSTPIILVGNKIDKKRELAEVSAVRRCSRYW